MFKIRHLLPLTALAAVLGYAVPSSAETIIDEWATVKAPSPPELKSVTLDPKTTAILVLDMLKQTCNEQRRPRCVTAYVDKFMLGDKDTGLQKILKDKGITTLVPVGTTPHNGVLFTSVLAALRGFNVVVPVDGMAGNNAYEDQVAAYTLANSIVYKVTLTSIDMVKFQ